MEPACTILKILTFQTADFSKANACGQLGVKEVVSLGILLQNFQE